MSPALEGRYLNVLPRYPANLLLAHLAVIWNTNPSEFLGDRPPPTVSEGGTLPAVGSDIKLPSEITHGTC